MNFLKSPWPGWIVAANIAAFWAYVEWNRPSDNHYSAELKRLHDEIEFQRKIINVHKYGAP